MPFSSQQYTAFVAENSEQNTPVTSHQMMGIYMQYQNVTIRYRIVDGDPDNIFRVSSKVMGDFCFLEMYVRSPHKLNREHRSLYTLRVKGQQRRSDRSRVNIDGAVSVVNVTVTDVNDLSPLFTQSEYSVGINEDTPIYSSVMQVKAEDADSGLNGQVYYSFKEPSSVFCIHPTLGIITLTRNLNFHRKSKYSLTIIAQDRGLSYKAEIPVSSLLTINVVEVNVYEPQMEIFFLDKIEARGNVFIYAHITVKDNDQGVSGLISSVEIVQGDPDRIFRIIPSSESNEFSLAALSSIDWNRIPHGCNLTLKATDRGIISLFSYKDIHIESPAKEISHVFFNKSSYEFSVSESAPPGTYIASISSWLPGQINNEIYEILDESTAKKFSLDPVSGVLTTRLPLDAETTNSYAFKVISKPSPVIDPDIRLAAVTIKVTDANDNTPMIVAPQGIVLLEENQAKNTWVVKVRAQDYDSGKNGDVSYSLANGDEVPFSIDHFTGEVRTTEIIDYESQRLVWKLIVRASDWGDPYRRQTEKIITIKMQDRNDNKPQFERIHCSGYIDRSAPMGTEIFTLSAIDFDAGSIISYRMVSGNEDRCFHLDAVTGVITSMCDLNDMQVNERILNATATDGKHFSDYNEIRLQLIPPTGSQHTLWTDVKCKDTKVAEHLTELIEKASVANARSDETPSLFKRPFYETNTNSPVIVNHLKEVKIPENSAIGSVVAKIIAEDNDSGYDGFIVYAIADGNYNSVFRMDSNTGELKVSGILDHETRDKYSLNLTAYDLGLPQLSTSYVLTVTILDENDNIPKFEKATYSFFLPESVSNGTNVYQLRAQDPDKGKFGSITYSLLTHTNIFSLDSITGQLSVSGKLDYEVTEVYELRIAATDGGGKSSQAYVMVHVADVNDCAPKFPNKTDSTIKIAEDLPIGSFITIINAHDADSSLLKYRLIYVCFYVDHM